MEFRLLGPVGALVNGELIDLGGPKERGLLAMLLLDPNRLVPTQRLIEALWDDQLPVAPRKALQVYMSRLRRLLTAGDRRGEVLRLVCHPGGYEAQIAPGSVDVHRFTQLVVQARQSSDMSGRAALLRQALALWRGPALADLVSHTMREQVCVRLDEARLSALELRIDADLALGRHDELIPELAELTARHPDREQLVAARMRALYGAGRQREALAVYTDAAQRLASELGLDPPGELRRLHLAIVRNEPLPAVAPAADPGTAQPPVPAQLPADLPTFTGRQLELRQLLQHCTNPSDAVVVTALHGLPGVGKTALAVHAAHRLRERYPDGQLFVDLHGFCDRADPVAPGDALARLLRALGVPDTQIPEHVEDRSALFRTRLAGRRMVIVLDNAASVDQVRPLLPGTPGHLVLVTSRRRLASLDQANLITLDVLPAADAVSLFARVTRALFAARDAVVREIVERCGRLPLAICIAAAQLRQHPSWTVSHLATRLAARQSVLAVLDDGERRIDTAFASSYRHLTAAQRRGLRLLGLHPGSSIGVGAAMAMLDANADVTRALLGDLHAVSLLQHPAPGRYRLHPLVHAFAADRAVQDEPTIARHAVLDRLLHYYRRTAPTHPAACVPALPGT